MVGDFQEPEKETPPAHPVLPEEFLPPVCESGLMRVVRDVLAEPARPSLGVRMGRILFSWTLWKWLLVAAALILLPIFLMSYLGVDWMAFARTLRELFLSRS